jgi:hypothetical protein
MQSLAWVALQIGVHCQLCRYVGGRKVSDSATVLPVPIKHAEQRLL